MPAYDKWFDPWAKEWGASKGIEVTVDHVGFADVVPRATAEVAAQSGHDIHMFLGLASAFEEHVIDLGDVGRTLEKKYGKQVELAQPQHVQPVHQEAVRPVRHVGARSGQLPQEGVDRHRHAQRAGDLRGPRQGGARDQEEVTRRCRSPSAIGLSPGHRLEHGRAQHPLVPRRLHPGQGQQRGPQLPGDPGARSSTPSASTRWA